jgi:adenylate kinase family enzyme
MAAIAPRRIAIVGVTGSGKSTLAERLAALLGLERIELDALNWKPGWSASEPEEFRIKVERATSAPAWIAVGNYGEVRDIVWVRAEVLIWLDYPLTLCARQLWQRTWRRWRSQELLWGTNRESLVSHLRLWSDASLFTWLLKTYWRRRRQFPLLFARPEHRHLEILHFRLPAETDAWLRSLEPGAA